MNKNADLPDVLGGLKRTMYEYAWKYFEFHARQRITMFNFFIVFSSIFIGACAKLLEIHRHDFLLMALFSGIIITYMFMRVDWRNEEFVHMAEDVLRKLEEEIFNNEWHEVKWPKRRNCLGIMVDDYKDDEKKRKDMKCVPLGIFLRQDDYDNCKLSRWFKEWKNSHGRWLGNIQGLLIFVYCSLIVYIVFLGFLNNFQDFGEMGKVFIPVVAIYGILSLLLLCLFDFIRIKITEMIKEKSKRNEKREIN